MQRIKFLLLAVVATLSLGVSAQNTDANVFGDVKSDGEHIPFANVYVKAPTEEYQQTNQVIIC